MLERDYLMRILAALGEGIRRAMERAGSDRTPEDAADLLEMTVGEAVDMDAATFLAIAPESLPMMLQISDTDPRAVEFIVRSLLLAGQYRSQAGQADLAALRSAQAGALADAYGISLDEAACSPEGIEAFLESQGV